MQQGIPFIFRVNNDDRKVVVICSNIISYKFIVHRERFRNSHHSHASTKSYDDILHKENIKSSILYKVPGVPVKTNVVALYPTTVMLFTPLPKFKNETIGEIANGFEGVLVCVKSVPEIVVT